MTRSSAAESTLASTIRRRPLTSTISSDRRRPHRMAGAGVRSPRPVQTSNQTTDNPSRRRYLPLAGLAPGENLARVQPISPRHRAETRSGHQRLVYNLPLIRPAPAPPAFDRDQFGSMHRPRSPPIATSRTWPCSSPPIKGASPSGYVALNGPSLTHRCRQGSGRGAAQHGYRRGTRSGLRRCCCLAVR